MSTFLSEIEEASGELVDEIQGVWATTEKVILKKDPLSCEISFHHLARLEGMQILSASLSLDELAEELFLLRLVLQERNHLLLLGETVLPQAISA